MFVLALSICTTSVLLGFLVVTLSLDISYGKSVILLIGMVLMLSLIRQTAIKVKRVIESVQWWHVLWLFLMLSGLTFRVRDTQVIQEDPIDAWAFYRIGLMSVLGLVLLHKGMQGNPAWFGLLFRRLTGFLSLYSVIAMVSTLWSVYPAWTLYRAIEYFIAVSLVAAIVVASQSTDQFRSFFDWTWLLMGIKIAIVWVEVMFWPERAIRPDVGLLGIQIQGFWPRINPNGVGELSAIIGAVAFTRLLLKQESRRFYASILLLGIITLMFSQSRAPLMGFVVAMLLVLVASKRIGLLMLLMLISGLVVTTSAIKLVQRFFIREQNPYLFATASGRFRWWKFGWNAFLERPFTGFGAYIGSRIVVLSDLGRVISSSIHNTYLEVLLGTGLPGLIPIILTVVGVWWLLFRLLSSFEEGTLERRLLLEALAVLAVVSVRSVFTTGLIYHNSITFFLVLSLIEFLRRNRQTDLERLTGKTALPSGREMYVVAPR
jgi:O-antigen ligase